MCLGRFVSFAATLGRETSGSGGEAEGTATESKTEVVGRKELNKALKDRGY
jgi:hypothetical protein